jgi:hypothetical protein
MAKKGAPHKGKFSPAGLPVATKYVYPVHRNRALLIGGAVGLVAAIALVVNITAGPGTAVAPGPLSSAHAAFETECASCHVSFEAAADTRCVACHALGGEAPSRHGLEAHYVYRSSDAARAGRGNSEPGCASCHLEHGGREATLVEVADLRCQTCHERGPFRNDHAEFAALDLVDDESLRFAHGPHVARVLKETEITEIEDSCATCHVAVSGSGSFKPISFEASCAGCHLGAGARSPNLPLRQQGGSIVQEGPDGLTLDLGVETLEAVRSRQGPGERWAFDVSPGAFRTVGRRTMKTTLDHRDPWIQHNLAQIRAAMYPDAELAALLPATARSGPEGVGRTWAEAVDELERRSSDLRGRSEPWLADDLEAVNALIARLRDRLAAGEGVGDLSAFDPGEPDPRLAPDQLDALRELEGSLTEPCAVCHQIEAATVASVRVDQQTFDRAEFDHRPHRLQVGCLDCHSRIPIRDLMGLEVAQPELDRAGIHNLPAVATCQQCHNGTQVPDRCSSCHLFHPDGAAAQAVTPGVRN